MNNMIENRNGRDVLVKKSKGLKYSSQGTVNVSQEHDELLTRMKVKSGYSKTRLVAMALEYFEKHVVIEGEMP